MHGEGRRNRCGECGQSIRHLSDDGRLAWGELRGPRQITSSNIDRLFDDGGKRFLVIEEKHPNEPVKAGQWRMLRALAAVPSITVWGVRGTRSELRVSEVLPDGKRPIATGSWADYQGAVDRWFQSAGEQTCSCGAAVGTDYCPLCTPF